MIRAAVLAFVAACAVAAGPVSAAVSAFAAPVVVVYPLTVQAGGNANEAGATVAVLLAQRLAESGGITVRPYTQNTTRAEFLDAANKLGADYYITGFLQPLGADVSMVVQLVSTHSGSVVYSTSAVIRTYADASALADPLRIALLRHAGRGLPALDQSAPPVQPTAEASTAPGVNLSRLGRRNSRATAAPAATSNAGLVPVAQFLASPSPAASPAQVAAATPQPATAPPATLAPQTPAPPTPAPRAPQSTPRATATPAPTSVPATAAPATPAPPSATVALAPAPVRGRRQPSGATALVLDPPADADPAMRERTADSLVNALRASGVNAAHLPATLSDVLPNAKTVCAANTGAGSFYAPTLVLGHDENGGTAVQLQVSVYGCDGTLAGRKSVVASGTRTANPQSALDRAATALASQLAHGG